MTPNPDRNERQTGQTTEDEEHTETGGGDDGGTESTETALTRRQASVGAGLGLGLGLGLLPGRGRTPPGKGGRPWNRDVDANGNDLLDLGGLNMTDMGEGTLLAEFDGPNLEVDDGGLRVTDRLDVAGIETAELTGGLCGGERVTDIAGENLGIDDNRLNAVTNWRRRDVLLEPTDEDVDGIEVEDVESPDEADLRVEADADLVLSVSGEDGAVRIETGGGHEIVLDDGDGAESLRVEDSAGNSVEMDAAAGEVSVSATERITLDAPTIELSADAKLSVESGGNASLGSAGVTALTGSLITLNGGAAPAARQGDPVE
ncbi:MAG: hypothetical protein V5A60_09865, partial [Haloarculaceae archaeon]